LDSNTGQHMVVALDTKLWTMDQDVVKWLKIDVTILSCNMKCEGQY
jgi:hypothetical protein